MIWSLIICVCVYVYVCVCHRWSASVQPSQRMWQEREREREREREKEKWSMVHRRHWIENRFAGDKASEYVEWTSWTNRQNQWWVDAGVSVCKFVLYATRDDEERSVEPRWHIHRQTHTRCFVVVFTAGTCSTLLVVVVVVAFGSFTWQRQQLCPCREVKPCPVNCSCCSLCVCKCVCVCLCMFDGEFEVEHEDECDSRNSPELSHFDGRAYGHGVTITLR